MATAYGTATKGTIEIPDIDDDFYTAMVRDVEDSVSTWNDEETPQYSIEWELEEQTKANGDPLTLRSFVRIPDGLINDGVLNENSKLYELLMAFGYEDNDLAIEPDDWQGKTVRINVENKEIKSGPNTGQVRPRITGYKPPKMTKPAAKATRKAPRRRQVEDDEDDGSF